MSRDLADILGWGEGEVYKLGDELFVANGDRLFFAVDDGFGGCSDWGTAFSSIDVELVELVNEAKRVKRRRVVR